MLCIITIVTFRLLRRRICTAVLHTNQTYIALKFRTNAPSTKCRERRKKMGKLLIFSSCRSYKNPFSKSLNRNNFLHPFNIDVTALLCIVHNTIWYVSFAHQLYRVPLFWNYMATVSVLSSYVHALWWMVNENSIPNYDTMATTEISV